MEQILAIIANKTQAKFCDKRNGNELRFSHNGLMDVESLKRGLAQPGKSQRGLARALNLDDAAVSRMVKGDRQIKALEIPKIEAYLFGPGRGPRTGPAETHLSQQGNENRIPVLGMAECGPDGWSLWNGDVVDYVPRPPNLAGASQAYAVFVMGTSMEPRYHPGELVYIHPGKPITVGSYVLVQLHPESDGEAPKAVLKRLSRRSGNKIVLEQFSPARSFTLAMADVVSVHRVVGSGEA